MNVTLNPAIARFVEGELLAGRYTSAEDVVHAGVLALMDRDRVERLTPEGLEAIYPDARAKLRAGLEEARQGRLSDGEAFFEELDREDDDAEAGRKTA